MTVLSQQEAAAHVRTTAAASAQLAPSQLCEVPFCFGDDGTLALGESHQRPPQRAHTSARRGSSSSASPACSGPAGSASAAGLCLCQTVPAPLPRSGVFLDSAQSGPSQAEQSVFVPPPRHPGLRRPWQLHAGAVHVGGFDRERMDACVAAPPSGLSMPHNLRGRTRPS